MDINRSLKNYDGKNYDGEYIRLGTYEYNPLHDKYGFRMVYHVQYAAYMIMPISSGNGKHRAIAKASSGNEIVLLDVDVNASRILFVIELQSDGAYVIKLQSTLDDEDGDVLVLTDNGNGSIATVSEYEDGTNAQKWVFSAYQYIMPDGSKVSYTDMENYYWSLGFSSPFGTTGYPLTLTSDFGVRYLSTSNPDDFHKGVDLRTGIANRDLFSPIAGKVIAARDNYGTNTSEEAEAGNYVVIETNITAYNNSNYKVCIVYMHMEDVNMTKLNQEIGVTDKIGTTGWTGLNSADKSHLHYGVFLRSSDMGKTEWNTYPLNPLMFFALSAYANG